MPGEGPPGGPAAISSAGVAALERYRSLATGPDRLARELTALADAAAALGEGSRTGPERALRAVLDVLEASRGGLLGRTAQGDWHWMAVVGTSAFDREPAPLSSLPPGLTALSPEARATSGLDAAYSIVRDGRTLAVLLLGPRGGGRAYGPEEAAFLTALSASVAAALDALSAAEELRRVNERLSASVFQLRNVLEVSRELVASLEADEIHSLLSATLMGQLLVSRCAVFALGADGLAPVHERGARLAGRVFAEEDAAAVVARLSACAAVEDLPPGRVKEELRRARMALVVPLLSGERVRGFVALGERLSGRPFTDEDCDFAQTLARQAQAALESIELHQVRAAKQRQDRELQIAREIQQSLFPRGWPPLPGFDVAAASVACYEVGGDHYDVIPLRGGRVALTVADVSGKGTPASLLMASVHASLRALAGREQPAALLSCLNRFLLESTQAERYVTLFYGELDPSLRRLRYVNAGHVPPCLLRADGSVVRLTEGGPVLGLLEAACYDEGEIAIGRGDTLALVTDGVTEALSADEQELGEEGMHQVLRRCRGRGANATLQGLLAAVHEWTGNAGCSDDLTALVVEAQ